MELKSESLKNTNSITGMLLLTAAVVLFQRITINIDSSASGSFQSSSAGYQVAASTILLISYALIFYQRSILKITSNPISLSLLAFYIYALISSVTSLLPLLSGFRASSGLGIVLAASAFGRHIAKNSLKIFEYKFFCYATTVCLAYTVGTALFQAQILGSPIIPLRGGMAGVISLYLAIWKAIDFSDSKKPKDLTLSASFIFLGLFLNSVSALTSFFLAILFLALMNGRILLFLLGTIAIAFATTQFIEYLNENIGEIIFNKSASAYLIGTGRVPLLEFAIDLYINDTTLPRKIFGYGFMAEREALGNSDLSWTTNLHNSMGSNLLGTGLFGFVFSGIFLALPIAMFRRIKKIVGARLSNKWIAGHLIFMFFGLTSADYPNSPGWLLLLFLTLNAGVFFLRSRLMAGEAIQ